MDLNVNKLGENMASRSSPIVININIDDGAEIFQLLGRGLVAVDRQVPSDKKEIDVYLGEGLAFATPDADGSRVMVQAGTGLGFDGQNNLVVKVGNGLVVNAQNEITTEGSQVQLAGKGLVVDPGTGMLDVNCGNGLDVNANAVEVKLGSGLSFASDGSITPVIQGVGNGLTLGPTNNVSVRVGAGLGIASDGSLIAVPQTPALGLGLVIDSTGRLAVENTNPGSNQTIVVLTDMHFSVANSVLYVSKVFTTYQITRADTGAVISVDSIAVNTETDTVTISGGYGSLFAPVSPPADPAKPRFYH